MTRWGDDSEPGWIDPAERAGHPAGGDPTVPAGEPTVPAGEPTEFLPPGGGPPGGPPGGPGGPGGPGDEDDEAARRRRLIWIMVGLGAAAVIIVVLLVLLLSGGGGGKTASTSTSTSTSTSSTTTTTLRPTTTTHATTPPTTAASAAVTISSFNVPATVTCSAPTSIAISWATPHATSVILSIDGAAYKTYSGPAGADSVPFACNGKTHTYAITAKNATSNATRSSTVTGVPATTTTT